MSLGEEGQQKCEWEGRGQAGRLPKQVGRQGSKWQAIQTGRKAGVKQAGYLGWSYHIS